MLSFNIALTVGVLFKLFACVSPHSHAHPAP